jgi:hypothetical protein
MRFSLFSKRNPGGYKKGGVLSKKEFYAGLQVSNAVQRGVTNLSPDAQKVLTVFMDGVGCAPRRTSRLPNNVIRNALRSLKFK